MLPFARRRTKQSRRVFAFEPRVFFPFAFETSGFPRGLARKQPGAVFPQIMFKKWGAAALEISSTRSFGTITQIGGARIKKEFGRSLFGVARRSRRSALRSERASGVRLEPVGAVVGAWRSKEGNNRFKVELFYVDLRGVAMHTDALMRKTTRVRDCTRTSYVQSL